MVFGVSLKDSSVREPIYSKATPLFSTNKESAADDFENIPEHIWEFSLIESTIIESS